jgi:hypothetical protein
MKKRSKTVNRSIVTIVNGLIENVSIFMMVLNLFQKYIRKHNELTN